MHLCSWHSTQTFCLALDKKNNDTTRTNADLAVTRQKKDTGICGFPLVCVTNNFFNWHTKPSNFSVEFTNFEFTRPAEFLGRHCFARAFGRKRRGCAMGRSFRVISGCFPQKHMQANKPQASWGGVQPQHCLPRLKITIQNFRGRRSQQHIALETLL